MRKFSIVLEKMRPRFLGVLTVLAIAVAGCSSSASAANIPSQLAAVMGCDPGKVTITGVHWFRERTGAWRVVGMITNNSSKAIDKLMTGVETYTSSGQPADQGEDVSSDPLDLLPGAQAPFTAWIDREIPNLDHFKIVIDECVLTDPVPRGQVQVRAGHMAVDAAGVAQVTAELVNQGTQPLLVNGLMAAIFNSQGGLVTAKYVDVATRDLAPGESGPVRASLDLPPGAAGSLASYKFFMDAVLTQIPSLPLTTEKDLRALTHYEDAAGHFHLLLQLTNPADKPLMAGIQATVYSNPGKTTVLDAASINTWIPLPPGQTDIFDLNNWGSLTNDPGLWDRISTQSPVIEVRIEPFLTWTAPANIGSLELENSQTRVESSQLVFSGKVVNQLANAIDNGQVTAMVLSKSGEKLVAVGSEHLAITDTFAPGQAMDYSFTVTLPAGVDPSSITTEINAQGQQP